MAFHTKIPLLSLNINKNIMNNLKYIFTPKSVAVIGASDKKGSIGNIFINVQTQ